MGPKICLFGRTFMLTHVAAVLLLEKVIFILLRSLSLGHTEISTYLELSPDYLESSHHLIKKHHS